MEYILLGLGIFFLLFLFIPIQISFLYLRNAGDDEIKIIVGFLNGLLNFNLRVPLLRIRKKGGVSSALEYSEEVYPGTKGNGEFGVHMRESLDIPGELWEKIQKWMDSFQRIYRKYGEWFKAFYDTVSVKSFIWESELGFANPALTGIAVGIAWQIKGVILGLLCANINSAKNHEYRINVKPNFTEERIATRLMCIFTLQIGYIIFTRIRYLFKKQ